MDWSSVLNGVIGGALVSLLFAAALAERGEIGRQRAHARRETRRAIAHHAEGIRLSDLRRGAGPADELAAVRPERQVAFARAVVDAAESLSRFRRWRVRRHLVRLVGGLHVLMAEEIPDRPQDPGGTAMRASLWFQVRAKSVEQQMRDHPGALDLAARDPQSDAAWQGVRDAVARLIRAAG